MKQALLVSSNRDSFLQLDSIFAQNDIETTWAESGSEALFMISERAFDLIIADESLNDMPGLDFAKKLISKNPMLNLAVVSKLSSQDFHEASEGLGIMMQLSPAPEESEAEKLLVHLNNILTLAEKTD